MNDTTPVEAGVPVAHCRHCAREVLTHVHLDATGEPRRLCFHWVTCSVQPSPADSRACPSSSTASRTMCASSVVSGASARTFSR